MKESSENVRKTQGRLIPNNAGNNLMAEIRKIKGEATYADSQIKKWKGRLRQSNAKLKELEKFYNKFYATEEPETEIIPPEQQVEKIVPKVKLPTDKKPREERNVDGRVLD